MLSVGRWRQISRPGIGTDQLKGTQKNAEKRECDSLQCGGGRQDAKPEGVALELRVPLPVGGKKATPISRCSWRRLHFCTKKDHSYDDDDYYYY